MRPNPQPQNSGRLPQPAYWSRALLAVCAFALGANAAFAAPSTTVVISQVYGGGGNASATYTNDFVELHNISTSSVSLSGWSLQYGPGTSGNLAWSGNAALSGSIPPGGYFLVMLQGGATGVALPTPDLTSTSFNMSGTSGKVALVNNTTLLTTASFTGTAPTGASIVDFIGFGTTAAYYEGAGRATAPSNNTTSMFRAGSGTTDTDSNTSDFAVAAVVPRNSATAVFPADTVAPLLTSTTPSDEATAIGVAAPLSATFNEPIFKGTGNVTVKKVSDNSTVYTIDVTTASVTTSGQTATINLPGTLGGSTAYYVNIDAGAFKDNAPGNNAFAGIADATTWNFTTAVVDNDPPVVATLSPVDGITNFPIAGNLVITYNEPILIGSGTILLKTGATTVESISVPGPRVTVSGTSLTIDPTAALSFSYPYSVEVPAGVVTDQALNPSPVIGAGAWTFTSVAQPSVLISQYYEGTGTSRYIELKNLTGSTVSLDGYRLTCWSNSDPAGNQGWKSGTQTTPRVTILDGNSIPANGYFLVADSGASAPEYAVVNNDLVVNNNPDPGATAFSGSQSIVLYSGATNDLSNIADAVSFVANDGADKSFYRLNDSNGFDFTTGSSILNYPATWTSDKTLPQIASAAVTDAWYLRASDLPEYLGLSITPTSFSEGAGPAAATATVTRTGSTAAELDVLITVNDTSEVTTDTFVTIGIGESEATFDLAAVNDDYLDGSQIVTVGVAATGLLSASAQVTVTDEPTDLAFPVVINEVDSDQADVPNDAHEFIELYNNSSSEVSLNGAILVLYNGNGSTSYLTIDLGGYAIPGHGYFVVGNPLVANASIQIPVNTLQNGADGVALYLAPPSLFPNGTPATTPSGALIDAVVYSNGQTDGAALLAALTPGKPEANENAGSRGLVNAVARIPDGGTAFDSALYAAQSPTPGVTNGTGDFTYWSTTNSGGQTADLDFDGDGIDNGAEYFMGTPGNAFTPNPGIVAGAVTWPRALGKLVGSFKVEVSDNLTTWEDASVNYSANLSISAGEIVFTMPTTPGRFFVRLNVVAP